MLTRRRRWPLPAVLIATVALTLVACGDDDDETETGAGGATTTTEASSRNVSEYCDKVVQIETLNPDIDFESLTPQQAQEATKKFVTEEVQPLAREIQQAAPAEVKADIGVLVAGIDKVATTGDFQAFEEDPAINAANDRTHAFDLQNCGWARQNVVALDYAFQGQTANAKAGPVNFEMRNNGKEMHELVVFKKKAGVTESFDVLLTLEEEEAQEKVDFHGGIEPIAPGEDDYVVTNLEEGEYLIACFLPVGATPEAFAQAEQSGQEPQGEPHALRGMRAIITVD